MSGTTNAADVNAPPAESKTILVLRTCGPNGEAHGGFRWPLTVGSIVEAPDWEGKAVCGNGLHGLPWGEGDWSLLGDANDQKWMVVKVRTADGYFFFEGKCKFRKGEIVYVGDKAVAIAKVMCSPEAIANVAACAKDIASGDSSKLAASGYSSQLAASGYSSQLAASGDSSQLAASGYSSKLAASGNHSKLAASGDYSQLAASGNHSQLAASGYSSQLAASGDSSQLAASGDSSKLAASGDYSQLAASGDYSKLAASGNYSKLAASGDYSVCVAAALGCRAKAGKDGCIALMWLDGKRPRLVVGYVGENGIKADTWYCVQVTDGKAELVENK